MPPSRRSNETAASRFIRQATTIVIALTALVGATFGLVKIVAAPPQQQSSSAPSVATLVSSAASTAASSSSSGATSGTSDQAVIGSAGQRGSSAAVERDESAVAPAPMPPPPQAAANYCRIAPPVPNAPIWFCPFASEPVGQPCSCPAPAPAPPGVPAAFPGTAVLEAPASLGIICRADPRPGTNLPVLRRQMAALMIVGSSCPDPIPTGGVAQGVVEGGSTAQP
jgi:hypothetical protein